VDKGASLHLTGNQHGYQYHLTSQDLRLHAKGMEQTEKIHPLKLLKAEILSAKHHQVITLGC
jgi:hypothetical protein